MRYSQPIVWSLIAVAAILRLAPHPTNFNPIGGIALFGGARLRGWQAYFIPLLAMAVTDPILSHLAGYPAYSKGTLVVYASILLYVLLGRMVIGASDSPGRMIGASVAGSTQFFVITNFFVWLGSVSLYPHNWTGLFYCYSAGLPFFSRTLLGDLFYSAILLSAFSLFERRMERTVSSRLLCSWPRLPSAK